MFTHPHHPHNTPYLVKSSIQSGTITLSGRSVFISNSKFPPHITTLIGLLAHLPNISILLPFLHLPGDPTPAVQIPLVPSYNPTMCAHRAFARERKWDIRVRDVNNWADSRRLGRVECLHRSHIDFCRRYMWWAIIVRSFPRQFHSLLIA